MENLLHYAITTKLGEGKHGETYLAWDSGLDRVVAVKRLMTRLITDENRGQFLRDMSLLSRLNDPHIGAFYSLESVDGEQYIVREYVEGDTIKELVGAGPLEYSRFLGLAHQLAQTLHRAHSHRVLHLNITSQNVFVSRRGRIRLTDFGLPFAQVPGIMSMANSSDLVYLAPEQLKGGQVDQRTDLYALGVVFYEMLTGRLPFLTVERTVLSGAILDGQSDFASAEIEALPFEARLLLKKLLAGNSEDRFASMNGLAVTLEEMLAFQTEEKQSVGGATPGGRARQYLLLAVLMALVLIFWLVITTVYK